MGVCNCSMFCCTLLYVHSSIAIILMGKRELVASLNLSSWCLVMVEWLFLAVPQDCLQFVIVVFPDHTHLLFLWGIYTYDFPGGGPGPLSSLWIHPCTGNVDGTQVHLISHKYLVYGGVLKCVFKKAKLIGIYNYIR